MEDGQFQTVLAINVFTDGTFAIANLMNRDAKHITRMCPLTSMVKGESNQYVMKDCLSLPQQVIVKFWKDATGKFQFQRIR